MMLHEFTAEDYKISPKCQPTADGKGPFIYDKPNAVGTEITFLVGSDEEMGSSASVGIMTERDHTPFLTVYILERSQDSDYLQEKVKEFFQQNETILESGSYEEIVEALDSLELEKHFQV